MKHVLIVLSGVVLRILCAGYLKSDISDNKRDTLGIKYVDIVHCTHTDYGYTDHPVIAVDLHKRYLDVALIWLWKVSIINPENVLCDSRSAGSFLFMVERGFRLTQKGYAENDKERTDSSE